MRLEKGYQIRKQKVLEEIQKKRKMSEGYTLESIRKYDKMSPE